MTAKEYLEQYRRLDNDIKIKKEQLDRLRELAEYVSPSGSGSRSGGHSDKVGRAVAKLVDAENELDREIVRLLDLKREIEGVIAKVDDPVLEQLLTLKYINCMMSLEQVAEALNKSWRHTVRLHNTALKKVENVIVCHTQSVL